MATLKENTPTILTERLVLRISMILMALTISVFIADTLACTLTTLLKARFSS